MLDIAQTVNVNFRLDEDVKRNMEQTCSELGLSMSAAFTIFAKKVSREKRIPFEVALDPFYSENKKAKAELSSNMEDKYCLNDGKGVLCINNSRKK